MSSKSDSEDLTILKTDVMGRVQRTQAERDAILDAFEASALSGVQFTRQHGLNYQTFMTWRSLRRKAVKSGRTPETRTADFTFVEVSPAQTAKTADPVVIHVGDRVKIELSNETQVGVVASLVKELSSSSR